MTKSGLNERDLKTIFSLLEHFPDVRLVHLFGSRAKGTYRKASDIDMAIMNDGLQPETLPRLKSAFEESSLPYLVDLVNYPKVEQAELRAHIERVGIPFFEA